MRHFHKNDIASLDKRFRANLINSITGPKPANLVGTVSAEGLTNLAVFSSAIHIGANPPLIGLLFRPLGEVERHTYDNIKSTGFYSINHVRADLTENAHLTSAKFAREESEFAKCGFGDELIGDFPAPFVAESNVKLGVRYVQEVPIEANGTILVIGEIELIALPEGVIAENGDVDLFETKSACVVGLDTYHALAEGATYPYAKPEHAEKLNK